MEEDGQIVVPGCVRNGVSAEIASQLFDEMTAFASYAFNKSHAAAYGVVAVRTGWLKRHYPVQFFAALLNSVSSDSRKGRGVFAVLPQERAFRLLPPDVNPERAQVLRRPERPPGDERHPLRPRRECKSCGDNGD